MVIYHTESQVFQLLENYMYFFQSQWGDERDFYCEDIQKQIFKYEKDILTAFGLPLNSDCYLYLFDKATFCFNHHHTSQWLYAQLSTKANNYFWNHRKNRIAKNRLHDNPFIALPEWDVPVNSYTVFLYNQILRQNTSEETVWNEFNILKKTNKIAEIYLLCFDENYHENALFHTLIDEGLYLLPAYLKWYHNRRKG